MSSDLDQLWHDPGSLAWDQSKEADQRQRYRELDAPLTRYLLGLGRVCAELPALPVDWDWGKSWEQNDAAGALPSQELLHTGRLTMALLLPLSLLFTFQSGKQMDGKLTGALAILFLVSNSLTMLHTRRAMAEGVLIFAVSFALWSFTQGWKIPWLAGLGMALAFNAKQSTVALFPVGLLAVLWLTEKQKKGYPQLMSAALQYVGMFTLITVALNPLWQREPVQAIQASWHARQDLLQQQVADTNRLAPEKVLQSPLQRTAAMLFNLYLGEPMFAEVGNYQAQTRAMEESYLNNPINHLFRDPVGAGMILTVTLFGFLVALIQGLHHKNGKRKILLVMILATVCQVAVIIWLIPLPWQRYIIPILPFACLWAAYGTAQILKTIYLPLQRIMDRKAE